MTIIDSSGAMMHSMAMKTKLPEMKWRDLTDKELSVADKLRAYLDGYAEEVAVVALSRNEILDDLIFVNSDR